MAVERLLAFADSPSANSKRIRLDSDVSGKILPDHRTEDSPPEPLARREVRTFVRIVQPSLDTKSISDREFQFIPTEGTLSETIELAIYPSTMWRD